MPQGYSWFIVIGVVVLVLFLILFFLSANRTWTMYLDTTFDNECVTQNSDEYCNLPIYSDIKRTKRIGTLWDTSAAMPNSNAFIGYAEVYLDGQSAPYLFYQWDVQGTGTNRTWNLAVTNKDVPFTRGKGKYVDNNNALAFTFF
jgi:hypothetical protein